MKNLKPLHFNGDKQAPGVGEMAQWWLGVLAPSPPEDPGLVLSSHTQSHLPAPVILIPKASAPSSGFRGHCTFMACIQMWNQVLRYTN